MGRWTVSSSARRGQVEPLPALIALAVFALALSMYGTVFTGLPLPGDDDVSEATITRVTDTITEGVVVQPDRLDRLEGHVPSGTGVLVRANGRTWGWGPDASRGGESVTRQVLVQTSQGAVPGTLRVSG